MTMPQHDAGHRYAKDHPCLFRNEILQEIEITFSTVQRIEQGQLEMHKMGS
jgi:hypothetical protein